MADGAGVTETQRTAVQMADRDPTGPAAQAAIERLPLRVTPPISALQAFERAASHLNFRLAAQDLAVSPSAISHQIRGLEQYYGVQLFLREGRVILTQDGRSFLTDVREALARLDRASRRLLRSGRADQEELRFKAAPLVAHTLLFPRLAEFEARHPQWRISVDVSASPSPLECDEAHVMLQLARPCLHETRLRALGEVVRAPVAAAGPPLDLADPQALARLRLIHVRDEPLAWSDWLGSAVGAGAQAEIWVGSLAGALDAAEQGLGVALAPYPLVLGLPGFAGRLQVAKPAAFAPAETLYLACRQELKEDRRVLAVERWMVEVFADLRRAQG